MHDTFGHLCAGWAQAMKWMSASHEDAERLADELRGQRRPAKAINIYRSAARATGRPGSTINRANRSRARGVSAALAWDTRTS